jgi:hypothetical protein
MVECLEQKGSRAERLPLFASWYGELYRTAPTDRKKIGVKVIKIDQTASHIAVHISLVP